MRILCKICNSAKFTLDMFDPVNIGRVSSTQGVRFINHPSFPFFVYSLMSSGILMQVSFYIFASNFYISIFYILYYLDCAFWGFFDNLPGNLRHQVKFFGFFLTTSIELVIKNYFIIIFWNIYSWFKIQIRKTKRVFGVYTDCTELFLYSNYK